MSHHKVVSWILPDQNKWKAQNHCLDCIHLIQLQMVMMHHCFLELLQKMLQCHDWHHDFCHHHHHQRQLA